MVKKDKKSKIAEQKARVAAKQTKKAAQKEKKSKVKGGEGDDSDAENVDLDAVLAEFAKQVNSLLRFVHCQHHFTSGHSIVVVFAS